MFEAIVEVFLIGTGAFVRWIFIGKKLKFTIFLKEKASYWTDLFLGVIIWVCMATLIYMILKINY